MNNLIGACVREISSGDIGIVNHVNREYGIKYFIDWLTGPDRGYCLHLERSKFEVVSDNFTPTETVIKEITIDGVRYTLTRVENQ